MTLHKEDYCNAEEPSVDRIHSQTRFSKSPEPNGARSKSGATERLFFCVQKHLASHLHYDFRLEYKGVLLSWAVPKGPSLDPSVKRLAMQVEDHPTGYGDFVGVIPSGYGAGIVMLWDVGHWMAEGNVGTSLSRGHLSFAVLGSKLKGMFALQRISKPGERPQWLLMKKDDEFATSKDVLKTNPLSVKSDKDFVGILKKDLPQQWLETPPVSGGEAGKLFATLIKVARGSKPKKKGRRTET